VEFFGVFACKFGVATNGIFTHFQQATDFSHADSFDDVFDDGNNFFFWQSRVEKDGSPAFGEAFIASATPQ
jgi:hypothetical protein